MKKILILKGASQYNAARSFCDEMQHAFSNMGYIADILDLTFFTDHECHDLFSRYDIIFSFDAIGTELYNASKVSTFFWTFLIDPPLYLDKRLRQISGNVMVSCIDRNHVAYIDKYYKNIPWTCFMPHGGITGEAPALIPFECRTYDTVILGSLQDSNTINSVIQSLCAEYDPLAKAVIDEAVSDLNAELTDIVINKTQEFSLDFDDDTFRELMYILRSIDALRRYRQRSSLVNSLVNSGIRLDVWGSGWEQLLNNGNSDRLRLHGSIQYDDTREIMCNSKILINIMPLYHDGSHERVFSAMQCGTLVATDKSTFLEECFNDRTDIVFYEYDHTDRLTLSINELLNSPESCQTMINNALSLSAGHTWSARAAAIYEITGQILSHSL